MVSHAAQIQALLARERENDARWDRRARDASGPASHRAPAEQAAERVLSGAALGAQARAARRGSAGASATA
jgi:hypothetical protein